MNREGARGQKAMKGHEVCPICGERVAPGPANPAYPFCSERCRTIDLGNWLEGTYRVAGPPADPDADSDDDPESHGPN